MVDRAKLRRKVFLDLLSAPSTVIPAVAGASALLVSWAADFGGGWLAFLGVAGLLAGAGSLATRLIYGVEQATQRAYREIEAQEVAQRENKLEQLYKRLKQDNDPRDETSLKELCVLYQQFKQDAGWAQRVGERSALEITNRVEKLYQGCIISLERSLELSEAAKKMSTSAGRRSLLDSREGLLEEVRQSVQQLAKTIDGVKALQVDQNSATNLAQIRQELDESLEVARRVEQRMQSLESELGRTELKE
jgi:hypothetical protein